MAKGVTFKVEPRHVTMFGPQGILAPLYQRQATKLALAEKERESQAQYEQLKSLTQLRAQLEAQLQAADPYRLAQAAESTAMAKLREFQLREAQSEDVAREDFAQKYAAAGTEGERTALVRQELARQGALQNLLPQAPSGREEFTMLPQFNEQGMFTGFERAAGHGYFPPAGYLGQQQANLPNIPMTWKDFAAEEDQVRQIVGGLGSEKLKSPVLDKLGIKQAGTLDNYLSKFMGGNWDRVKIDEANAVFAFISDPKNAGVIAKDKQIQTILTSLVRLQRSYDPVWRAQMLPQTGAAPVDTTQAGVEDGFEWWKRTQGGTVAPTSPVGGGLSSTQPVPTGQQLVPSGISFPTPEQFAQYQAYQQQKAASVSERETDEQAEMRRKAEELLRRMEILRYYQLGGRIIG